MQLLPIIQKVMGMTLTAGFFAHDVDFTEKFIGFNLLSLIFLVALLWFHILVYLEQAGYAQVNALSKKKLIERLRITIAILTCGSCLLDNLRNMAANHDRYFSPENIFLNVVTILIFVFPEMIFKIIFAFEPKNK